MGVYELKKPYKFEVRQFIAKNKSIPRIFEGMVLRETAKGLYIYGQGLGKPHNYCCSCGRALTHPVSILTGIGPECGQHYWDEAILGPYGFTEAHADQLKQMIRDIRIDGWFPKSAVKGNETSTVIELPTEHPMIGNDGESPEKAKKGNTVKKVGKIAQIRFDFDYEMVRKVKTLKNKKFVGKDKKDIHWTASITPFNIDKLIEWGFDIDPLITAGMADEKKKNPPVKIKKIDWSLYPEFNRFMPFQRESVDFIQLKNGRAIVGEEMGLGKTIETIAWAWINGKFPLIAVVPATVKLKWKKEFSKWLGTGHGLDIFIAYGKTPDKKALKQMMKADVVIINYDIIGNKLKTIVDKETGKKKKIEIGHTGWIDYLLEKENIETVICDECHRFKNSKIGRTMAIRKLGKIANHFIPISGTIIKNRPIEAWNAINIIDPDTYNFWEFATQFCGAENNGYGWNFKGASNEDQLHEYLKTIMTRHLKKDVQKDLPDKIRDVVPIELTNRKEYDLAEADFLSYLGNIDPEKASKAKRAEAFTKMSLMKNLCIKGKIDGAIEWIEDFFESENKLVVFCTHQKPIDQLMEHFKGEAVKIDGSCSLKEREVVMERFQTEPDMKLFVGNIKAAGEAIELTASFFAAFLELADTPGDHDQAEDRIYGRLNDSHGATYYYLMADNTIEMDLAEMLDDKRVIIDAIVDGKKTVSSNLLLQLMKKIKTRKTEMGNDIPF